MKNVIERIHQAEHVVVIAHIHPDADSLGSASALYTYMLQLHKKVTFFCKSRYIDEKLEFLPWFDKIKHSIPSSVDLAISVDCGSRSRLGVEIHVDLINFDHHQSNDLYAQYNVINAEAISTTQVIYDFFNDHEIRINQKMATALYAGLLDDSSNFLSYKTDVKTFDMAKDLCELGAEIQTVSNYISKYLPLSAFRLKGAMMRDVRLYDNAGIAFFVVSQKMLEQYGAHPKDCETALEEGLYLPTVEVSVLLCETKDLSIKGSMRSQGELDVDEIAQMFNGGGHKHASGFVVWDKTLDEMESRLRQILTLKRNL
jgi:bifunctional oligoribonuclease and PAP phosphatase NrnA